LLGLVGFILKVSIDDTKQQKTTEDLKIKRVSDLEAETARKDTEMKKMMDERQKLEDEFFKVKDEIEVFRKENSELTLKMKSLEKSKEDLSEIKADSKQKDTLLQQETVARQKLQGELSLRDLEADKLEKEIERLKNELKSKSEVYEGLKGQYNELEAEIQKIREGALNKSEPVKMTAPKLEPPIFEKPQAAPAPEAPPLVAPLVPLPKPIPPVAQPAFPVAPTASPAAPKSVPPQKSDELPGFPKPSETKIELKQGVPSDTDFLKAQASAGPEKKEPEKKTPEKDKASKFKKETLIPGFQPKKDHPEEPAA
jgi:predicted  nucleic acid-binding Zn-ribbon protein